MTEEKADEFVARNSEEDDMVTDEDRAECSRGAWRDRLGNLQGKFPNRRELSSRFPQ